MSTTKNSVTVNVERSADNDSSLLADDWTSEMLNRDLRIVFFVRSESRIESAVRFVFESNLRIESAVYHASRNTA